MEKNISGRQSEKLSSLPSTRRKGPALMAPVISTYRPQPGDPGLTGLSAWPASELQVQCKDLASERKIESNIGSQLPRIPDLHIQYTFECAPVPTCTILIHKHVHTCTRDHRVPHPAPVFILNSLVLVFRQAHVNLGGVALLALLCLSL